jgi:hypothetical protein
VAEEPQQVVQQAVKAADEVQKGLHEVSRRLREAQRHLRDERGHRQAAAELRQAHFAATRVQNRLPALDWELRTAMRVVGRARGR